jgi:hypothetical protein
LYLIQTDRKPNKDFLELIDLEKGNYSLKVLPFFPARFSGKPERYGAIPGPCFDRGTPRVGKVLGDARTTHHGPNFA